MAVLTEQQRSDAWAELMRKFKGSTVVTKAQLRAALDAVDDWVDANTTSFNNAIPQPQRSDLNTEQKAQLLMVVVSKRFTG